MPSHKLAAILRSFVPLAVAITLLAGLIYITAQQVLRQGGDDPQIQLAQDAAAAIERGGALPGGTPVDIGTSLAVYEIQYDGQGQPVAGTGRLHDQLPQVPPGALQASAERGMNRVTWQPERGVRSAAVIVPVAGGQRGYVLAGRSLRQVEARESAISGLVAAGWLLTLLATLLAVAAANLL